MEYQARPNYEHKIMYVPPLKQYNGVLILLRESHDPEGRTEEEYLNENIKWFKDVIVGKPGYAKYKDLAKARRSVSKYNHRFSEMLSFVSHNQQLKLTDIVFGNINTKGGGPSTNEDYKDVDKPTRLNEILHFLNENGYITTHAFVCKEIFQLISHFNDANVVPDKGLMYSNKEQKGLAIWKGIQFYEIYHPARSPRIIPEN